MSATKTIGAIGVACSILLAVGILFVTLWLLQIIARETHGCPYVRMDILNVVSVHVVSNKNLQQPRREFHPNVALGNVLLNGGPNLDEQ